jgi:glycosyltransferase involved in cell wall biosynthesis
LLNIGTVLRRQFGLPVRHVFLESGDLLSRYEENGPCTVLSSAHSVEPEAVFATLAAKGFTLAIANTTVSGKLVQPMKKAGLHVVSLVHELPGLIRNYGIEASAAIMARESDLVVFPGKFVRDRFQQLCGEIAAPTSIKPQGLYRREIAPDTAAPLAVRSALGLPQDAKLVLNVGYGDLRKGFDLFSRVAKAASKRRDDIFFVWVGKILRGQAKAETTDNAANRDNSKVVTVGQRHEVSQFYAAADVFFLSSREDPYPSVVLEALAAGLPDVGFAGATGCELLIETHGTTVPFEDVDAAAAAIGRFLDLPADSIRASVEARIAEIRTNYDYKDYCFWLLQQFKPELRRVSVVVPNYNHERYLQERLGSIFKQSYPVYQVVVLDDASSDGSVSAIKRIAADCRREIALVANDTNSGSLAKQWSKGLAQCTGDFVWIAESDDVADPAFLAECVQALERSGADFCFTDSWQIDGEGKRIGNSYVRYVDDIEPGTFTRDFVMPGHDFVRRFLAVKNVILNMSGVLWRREVLVQAIVAIGSDLDQLRITADWRLYIAASAVGHKVAYVAQPLNGHRRHQRSITSSLDKQRHADEVRWMQAIASREVTPDSDVVAKAEQHLAHVHNYLGVVITPTEETADAR